jgi:hypothetical protein
VGHGGQGAEIGDLEQGVGDHLAHQGGRSLLTQGGGHGRQIGHVDEARTHAQLGQEGILQGIGGAVDVGGRHHRRPGTDAGAEQSGVDGGHARGKGHRRLGALQVGHGGLEAWTVGLP